MKIYQKLLALAVITATSSLLFSAIVYGDDDEGKWKIRWLEQSKLDVAPVNSPLYRQECGSCHFAYQPGLLPNNSWQTIMAGLEDHFGDNAELDAETQKIVLDYLLLNSADKSNYKRSKRIVGSLKEGKIPLSISDTLYFKHKHDEIPARYVTGNKEVGSYSRCAACHRRAESGSYNEDEVNIPGVGRWDD